MADFRKWIYAFALVALFASLTIPASAQVTPMSCTVTANNPIIRAEEYTALTGDVFVRCTGGTPTVAGQVIPKVDITVIANAPITSKLTDTVDQPAFNEALLIVDDAGSAGSTASLLNCGDTAGAVTAPYAPTPAAPFTCNSVAPNSLGTGGYDGTNNRPNVFQGRQFVNSNGFAIQFLGVPVDPPSATGTRVLRITNLRVNAASFGVFATSTGFNAPSVQTTVSINGTNFGGNQVLQASNGTVRPGFVVGCPNNNATTACNPTSNFNTSAFLQCSAVTATALNTITVSEGFATAFKVRNFAQIVANGTAPAPGSGNDWTYNAANPAVIGATDLNQNVPSGLYNTESGLMNPLGSTSNPTPNPPVGTGSGAAPVSEAFSNGQGIAQAGIASQGTRIAIQFTTIPIGSNPSVPLTVPLTASANTTGVLLLVCGTDTSGAGGTAGSCANGTVPASGLVVYEVAFSSPSALESAIIPVTVNPTVSLNANPPVGGTPQVNVTAQAAAGFAPFYPGTATGFTSVGQAQPLSTKLDATGAPIPRFRDDVTTGTKINVYSYSRCACDLLFPWVVADATYTTSIIVSNTSLDPGTAFGFNAVAQGGNVTFWFYGTTDITFDSTNGGANPTPGPTAANVIASQTTAATTANPTAHPVPAGSYVAFVISPSSAIAGAQTAKNNLGPIVDGATGKVATSFAGYVIAQSEFQYCHGVANISASGLSNTYLGLVLDKAGDRGIGGIQKTRTNQTYADELNN